MSSRAPEMSGCGDDAEKGTASQAGNRVGRGVPPEKKVSSRQNSSAVSGVEEITMSLSRPHLNSSATTSAGAEPFKPVRVTCWLPQWSAARMSTVLGRRDDMVIYDLLAGLRMTEPNAAGRFRPVYSLESNAVADEGR